MKKALLLFMCIFLIMGCSCFSKMNTPSKKAEEFLKKYKMADESIMTDLDLVTESTGLTTTEHKEKYKELMKKQYKDLTYKVQKEVINGDEATVDINITVYDLYKAKKEAEKYTIDNETEFYKNEESKIRDIVKVNEYILKKMDITTDKIDYTITLNLTKKDGKWIVDNPDTETKEKIHGIYNYESK